MEHILARGHGIQTKYSLVNNPGGYSRFQVMGTIEAFFSGGGGGI